MIPRCGCCGEHIVRFPTIIWCPICDRGGDIGEAEYAAWAWADMVKPYDWSTDPEVEQ